MSPKVQTYNTRIFITLLVLSHFDPQQDLLNLRWCWPPEDNVLTLEVKLFLFYLQEVLNLNWIWNYPRPFFCHLYLATKSLVMIAKERYTWKISGTPKWVILADCDFFRLRMLYLGFLFFHKLVGGKRQYYSKDWFLHILTENMIIWFSFLSKIGRR